MSIAPLALPLTALLILIGIQWLIRKRPDYRVPMLTLRACISLGLMAMSAQDAIESVSMWWVFAGMWLWFALFDAVSAYACLYRTPTGGRE